MGNLPFNIILARLSAGDKPLKEKTKKFNTPTEFKNILLKTYAKINQNNKSTDRVLCNPLPLAKNKTKLKSSKSKSTNEKNFFIPNPLEEKKIVQSLNVNKILKTGKGVENNKLILKVQNKDTNKFFKLNGYFPEKGKFLFSKSKGLKEKYTVKVNLLKITENGQLYLIKTKKKFLVRNSQQVKNLNTLKVYFKNNKNTNLKNDFIFTSPLNGGKLKQTIPLEEKEKQIIPIKGFYVNNTLSKLKAYQSYTKNLLQKFINKEEKETNHLSSEVFPKEFHFQRTVKQKTVKVFKTVKKFDYQSPIKSFQIKIPLEENLVLKIRAVRNNFYAKISGEQQTVNLLIQNLQTVAQQIANLGFSKAAIGLYTSGGSGKGFSGQRNSDDGNNKHKNAEKVVKPSDKNLNSFFNFRNLL